MAALRIFVAIVVTTCLIGADVSAQQETIYDEVKVPEYELPDPLRFNDGTEVTSPQQWKKRRAEILELFKANVYGVMPPAPEKVDRVSATRTKSVDIKIDFKQLAGDEDGGRAELNKPVSAKLIETTLVFEGKDASVTAKLLLILPADEHGNATRVPVFLAYNFGGNHTIDPSPEISLNAIWKRSAKNKRLQELTPGAEKDRGSKSSRWPLGMILSRGYGVATLYYGDVDPDFYDEYKNGVHAIYPGLQARSDNWSSIGAWAWGLHRVMDYFENEPMVDHTKVALLGHSRLGKTALWAGATDERFPVVISNNSGCGGAALSRRRFGESVERINKNFPHWFCSKFDEFSGNENKLPVDQHMLIALMAPRAVYIASAEEDRWADPRGEFLSAVHAGPVYQLLGEQGLGVDSSKMPAVNTPVGKPESKVGYHIRSGKHDVKEYDWKEYLKFARRHFEN